jgi:Adenine-specific methyltransferase EcoRI
MPKNVVDLEKFTGEIRKDKAGNDIYYQRVVGVRWFTNLDHGRRHQILPLMTEPDIIKFVTGKPFEQYNSN